MKPDWPAYSALLPKTFDALVALVKEPYLERFALVGGSALALYLDHRKSEDLDFFSWEKELDKTTVARIVTDFDPAALLLHDSATQQDWSAREVKITFFAHNWPALYAERVPMMGHGYTVSENLLCAMKTHTLFLRAKYRDYYDLYALSRAGWKLGDMLSQTQRFFPSVSEKLFQIALLYTDDILEDQISHLTPRYRTTLPKISAHFERSIARER